MREIRTAKGSQDPEALQLGTQIRDPVLPTDPQIFSGPSVPQLAPMLKTETEVGGEELYLLFRGEDRGRWWLLEKSIFKTFPAFIHSSLVIFSKFFKINPKFFDLFQNFSKIITYTYFLG